MLENRGDPIPCVLCPLVAASQAAAVQRPVWRLRKWLRATLGALRHFGWRATACELLARIEEACCL